MKEAGPGEYVGPEDEDKDFRPLTTDEKNKLPETARDRAWLALEMVDQLMHELVRAGIMEKKNARNVLNEMIRHARDVNKPTRSLESMLLDHEDEPPSIN